MIEALEDWMERHPGSEVRYRCFEEGGKKRWIFTLEDPADRGPKEFVGKDRYEARAELCEFINAPQLRLFQPPTPTRVRLAQIGIGRQSTPYGGTGQRRYLLGEAAAMFQPAIWRAPRRRLR